MRRGINLVLAAFALTALSYGLARFAYGLLLPQIRQDLALSVSAAGWIGGGAFAAYCLGIVATFVLSAKVSPRGLTVMAGAAASLGMALIVIASSGLALGCGVALAGLSTGLTSPPLASAVAARLDDTDRPRANGFINAGTAAGIVFSGLAAILAAGQWRQLYALFGLIGIGVTFWLWFAIPRRIVHDVGQNFSLAMLRRPGVLPLCASAFLMGLASTAIWTFGADILRSEAGFSDRSIAGAWIVLGAAGISGCATGVLTDRFGVVRMQHLALAGIAVGTLGLAATGASAIYGLAAMCLFGAAYIVSSGVYLLQGIRLFADRPDLGLGIPFLLLALGQTAGTPIFGAVLEATGVTFALCVFAAAACAAMVLCPRDGESPRRQMCQSTEGLGR
ncbi:MULTISPECIES: MFS transporter [Pseudomonas]|uniref:MFS transporter n=1 Tax=Pseudomonas mercuritolerans TaxID=2951809 RepID=A0ABT2Y3A6_9PSED|nr:MFS transporter [Pseudomonas mercuritolerans]MBR7197569.1 MFS transporter [Pseudomonas sp. 14A]MCV2225148.1 MFS transporter [Pseudomonas mercuritolerans]